MHLRLLSRLVIRQIRLVGSFIVCDGRRGRKDLRRAQVASTCRGAHFYATLTNCPKVCFMDMRVSNSCSLLGELPFLFFDISLPLSTHLSKLNGENDELPVKGQQTITRNVPNIDEEVKLRRPKSVMRRETIGSLRSCGLCGNE